MKAVWGLDIGGRGGGGSIRDSTALGFGLGLGYFSFIRIACLGVPFYLYDVCMLMCFLLFIHLSFLHICGVLKIRVPFRVLFITVPYHLGDLSTDSNLESCPYIEQHTKPTAFPGSQELLQHHPPSARLQPGCRLQPTVGTHFLCLFPKVGPFGSELNNSESGNRGT